MQKCSYSDRVVPLRSGHPFCNKKSGVIRKMVSCEGDNLVVFYYLNAYATGLIGGMAL